MATIALEDVVTLACLGYAADSRLARHIKDLTGGAEPAGPLGLLFDAAMDRLEIRSGDRNRRVQEARARAAQAVRRAADLGLTAVPWFAARYPPLLRQLPDPPVVLWIKGTFETLHLPLVAIVGARNATPTGVRVASTFGEGLATVGLGVVSGLARGIDAAAHRGALEVRGTTIGVLGCGADVVYPAGHRDLADQVARAGAIVSELVPGTPPVAHHFPLRNRIISGLARATIVIEASYRSGSLITARAALEQGREVFVVPGNVLSGNSGGCHALIKDGAPLVETVGDVLGALGWVPGPPADAQAKKSLFRSELAGIMAKGEPYSLDDLVAASARDSADVLAELTALELDGVVARAPGGHFVRLDKGCYD